MNNKIAIGIAFGLGAAIGSVVTWKFVKTTYERIAQEEIDSVKETYSKKFEELVEDEPEQQAVISDSDRDRFAAIVTNYSSTADTDEEGGSAPISLGTPPFIISPEEYGEIDEYEPYGFTYYSDGVLTDEGDEPIEDIESYVPADFASYFGQYEDDAVHVRNHIRKADYEILRDERPYQDVKDSVLNPSDDI